MSTGAVISSAVVPLIIGLIAAVCYISFGIERDPKGLILALTVVTITGIGASVATYVNYLSLASIKAL